MNTEAAILAAFPGDDELHKAVRISLLKLTRAGEKADRALDDLAGLVSVALADPPYGAWWHSGDVRYTVQNLLAVVAELESADAVLADAWKRWNRPTEGVTPDVEIQRPGAGESSSAESEYPF